MSSIPCHPTGATSAGLSSILRRFDPPHECLPDTNLKFVVEVAEQLRSFDANLTSIHHAVDRLFVECKRLRDHLPKAEWMQSVKQIRNSEILELVHQDPFTYRAFNKPRGYAGDAVMMDFIYGLEENWSPPPSSPLGNGVFQYTTKAAASAGVRSRREFIAEKLDEVVRQADAAEVLAVASGHLREASMSSAVRRRRFGRFVALDADAESLKEVHENYGRFGVECELANIRKMLTGRMDLGAFDLVYSTGLYDYLNEKTAKILTQRLFAMLNSGGKLVVANFLPSIEDIGYMEACMDWFLIYRDRVDMMGLTQLIDQREIRDIRVSAEENQNIIFLEIIRA
ncbi:MAG: class I SAM-dependent methyltransferase [Pirellula sp.]